VAPTRDERAEALPSHRYRCAPQTTCLQRERVERLCPVPVGNPGPRSERTRAMAEPAKERGRAHDPPSAMRATRELGGDPATPDAGPHRSSNYSLSSAMGASALARRKTTVSVVVLRLNGTSDPFSPAYRAPGSGVESSPWVLACPQGCRRAGRISRGCQPQPDGFRGVGSALGSART
jgi:hypothetical protein